MTRPDDLPLGDNRLQPKNKLITYSVEPERVSVHRSVSTRKILLTVLGLLLLAIHTTYNQLTTCMEHCTTPLPDKGTLQDHVP